MKYCVIDFETFSRCDLKKCGARVYASDFSTHILCLGYKIVENDKPQKTIVIGESQIQKLHAPLLALVNDPAVMFIAHNASFEQEIWRNIMVEFSWPDISDSRWHDTMAVAAMKGLPLGLDALGRALKLPIGKDMKGHQLMMQMCKPRSDGAIYHSPDKMARLMQYCATDVDTQHSVHTLLGPLGSSERENWLLNTALNSKGVKVDPDFIRDCMSVIQQAKKPMNARFLELTGGLKPTQREKVLNWVNNQGFALGDMKKETINRLLDLDDLDPFDQPIPSQVFEVLTLRQSLTSTSLSKLERMLACADHNGRVAHTMQYHGARTGRIAGRLIQIQNFPRGHIAEVQGMTSQHLVSLIKSRDIERLKDGWGHNVHSAVVSSLRSCIIPEKGKILVAGDYAAVEARNVLSMAGQHDKVQMMYDGIDVYCDVASRVFGRKITKADARERHLGKGAVLGAGYGLGPVGFRAKSAPYESIELAQNIISTYRNIFAPKISKLWYGLSDAAIKAVWCKNAKTYHHEGIEFRKIRDFLTMRLPSSRLIFYHKPEQSSSFTPSGQKRDGWTFENYNGGGMIRKRGWHGLITADLIQGSARDLLAFALKACEREGLNPVFSVHDEIVCETKDRPDLALTLKQVMEDIPQWAVDRKFMVTAECGTMERYRK